MKEGKENKMKRRGKERKKRRNCKSLSNAPK
jgi:hypothetical protein